MAPSENKAPANWHVKARTCKVTALLACLMLASGCGSSQAPQATDEGGQVTAPDTGSPLPDGAIDYAEARSHVGETIAVFGQVKSSDYYADEEGQPTYLDIGQAYPEVNRVTMVVEGEDRDRFPGPPEDIYLGKTVCVTGELYKYEGVVYINVSSPDQVRVLE